MDVLKRHEPVLFLLCGNDLINNLDKNKDSRLLRGRETQNDVKKQEAHQLVLLFYILYHVLF